MWTKGNRGVITHGCGRRVPFHGAAEARIDIGDVITHPHFQRIQKWRAGAADFRMTLAMDCNL